MLSSQLLEFNNTSIKILEGLLACDPSRYLYYSELINLLAKIENDGQAKNILQIAQNNLSRKDFFRIKRDYKKSFNKAYYVNNFRFTPIYSDNYNSGIDAEFIEVFNLPFKTSENSKPKKGLGLKSSIQLSNFLPNGSGQWNKLNLSITQTDYPNSTGDVGAYSLSYENSLRDKSSIIYSITNVRFKQQNFLTNYLIGYKFKYSQKIDLLLGLIKKNYVDDFQGGEGAKISLRNKESFLSGGFLESYSANSNTYSFDKIGLSSKRRIFYKRTGYDFSIESSYYKGRFEAFGKKRNDQSLNLNFYIGDYFDFYSKLSFVKRKSNLDIFDTNNINFEIYLN